MTWYAIRTMPGFQAPNRERWPEPSASALKGQRRGRGYTIASALNPDMSKIEANLEVAGLVYYMPVEYIAVRNRSKARLYELRRFALLKGYMFVELAADEDWHKLSKVIGIKGIVGNCGQPFVITALDLFRLRMYEQSSKAAAKAKAESLSKAGDRLIRDQRKIAVRGARKKLFPGRDVKLLWGDYVGRDATVQAWNDADQVSVLLSSLDAAETITVPYEYLKVAS